MKLIRMILAVSLLIPVLSGGAYGEDGELDIQTSMITVDPKTGHVTEDRGHIGKREDINTLWSPSLAPLRETKPKPPAPKLTAAWAAKLSSPDASGKTFTFIFSDGKKVTGTFLVLEGTEVTIENAGGIQNFHAEDIQDVI